MAEHIHDHVARAQARLLEQYRSKESYRKVVALETAEHQVLEDEIQKIAGDSIDNAVGAQLDVWGRVVGMERGGRDDASYRVWVKARFLVIRSGGQPDMLITILQTLAPECSVRLLEEFPAALTLRLGAEPPVADPTDLAAIVRVARMGGVRSLLVYQSAPDADTFRLDVGPGLDVGKLADVKE